MTLWFVDGFGLRPQPAGLEVAGGKRTVRLKGRDRQALTLRVVGLLRGGASLEEAAERLAVPLDRVRACVAPLVRLGVLARSPVPPANESPQMARYFRRSLGVDAAATALDRLARSTVYLDGDGPLRALLGDQLRRSGVGTVADWSDQGHPDHTANTDGPPVLLVTCDASFAEEPDLPTLFVTRGADEVAIGPLCDVPGGNCLRCRDRTDPPPEAAADPTTVQAGVAVAAGEVVRFLSGTGHCRTGGGRIVVRSSGRDQSFEPTARDARCPRCGFSDATLAQEPGYRWLQAADVPLKMNWSHPIDAVELPGVDSTIRVITRPGNEPRPGWDEVLAVVREVFAPKPRSRRYPVPSVGGAHLLNVFACGVDDGRPFLYYLDRRHGSARPMYAAGLAESLMLPADHLVVIVSAILSRAENLFGARANLTVHQDTGFALDVLRASLADAGFHASPAVTAPNVSEAAMRVLGIDTGRDIVTAVVPIGLARVRDRRVPRNRRRASTSPVDRHELTAALAAASHDGTYVRCQGLGDGLYRLDEGELRPVPIATRDIDAALGDRRLTPDALVLFGSDIGHALARRDVAGCVIEQAQAAGRVRRAARERGLDAALCTDLPSTALAPDGRGWRTAYRSFAAVALAAPGALGGGDEVVRW